MPDFKAVSANKAYVFDNAIFVSPVDFVALKNSAPWITQGPKDADVTSLSCRINRGPVMCVKYVPSHTPPMACVPPLPDLEWTLPPGALWGGWSCRGCSCAALRVGVVWCWAAMGGIPHGERGTEQGTAAL